MIGKYQLWALTQAGAQAAVLENAFGISRGKEANATGTSGNVEFLSLGSTAWILFTSEL
jgi:hypothetical protein